MVVWYRDGLQSRSGPRGGATMTETEDACRKRATAERQRETRPTAFAPPMTETETGCMHKEGHGREKERDQTNSFRSSDDRDRGCMHKEGCGRGREKERDQTNSFCSSDDRDRGCMPRQRERERPDQPTAFAPISCLLSRSEHIILHKKWLIRADNEEFISHLNFSSSPVVPTALFFCAINKNPFLL